MNVGICPAKLTVPSSSAECVSRYTSHDVAMRVIHVPMSEIVCPPKNSRKLRCRNARHAKELPAVSVRSVRLFVKLSPCALHVETPIPVNRIQLFLLTFYFREPRVCCEISRGRRSERIDHKGKGFRG